MENDRPGPETADPPPLTVADLMALLAEQPPDALVLVPGYEGGFNAALGLSAGLVRKEERGWYFGEWWPTRADGGPETRPAVALMPDTERLSSGAQRGLDDIPDD